MTTCPSDETLARLLADALSATERDALAQHVEACGVVPGKARSSDRNVRRRRCGGSAEHFAPRSEAEEEIVRRLKLARRSPAPVSPEVRRRSQIAQGVLVDSAVIDSAWPAVPGYEIIGVLGRGGMAVVFKARHLALAAHRGLEDAPKTVPAGEKELARFRAEADVIARLQHPNIVQIYDVGDVAGRPYFALEYVAGGSLAQHLNGTPQSARLAAQFVEVLARAVQAAHANGVVHRDLKPANILLVSAPQGAAGALDETRGPNALAADGGLLKAVPKIADFGVAKCADGDWEAQLHRSLTVTGDLLGTPSYMAPEQAAPIGPPVGPAADIYALGAILYELLTGRPPFKGATPLDTVLQVLHNEPVSVTGLQPNVPRDLETICLKCLRKEPRHRYQSASELADDLQSFLRGEPIKARPQGTGRKSLAVDSRSSGALGTGRRRRADADRGA